MLQHFAQSLPETRVWDFFLPDIPCIGPCTNFEPHRHWANTKCSYDFASDVTKDANGNMIEKATGDDVTYYTYDVRNRLITVDDGVNYVQYEYDADNVRTAQIVNGNRTEYLVDKNRRYHQVLEERDDTGALLAEYSYGNQRIRMRRDGEDRFYHYDGQGSVTGLSDSTGAMTDTYTYSAFGNLVASTGISFNPYLYTGEAWDKEAGLEYLRARYYNPEIGRFMTMDPHPGSMMEPLSLNKYLYGNANPVMFVDPSGMFGIVSISISINIGSSLGSVALARYGEGIRKDGMTSDNKGYRFCRGSEQECVMPRTLAEIVKGVDEQKPWARKLGKLAACAQTAAAIYVAVSGRNAKFNHLQKSAARLIEKNSIPISRAAAQPGDLITYKKIPVETIS